jgi:hypothetical protein
MRSCYGITELCWSSLSEDHRVSWKYFSRVVAILGALIVAKTGNLYIDWLIGTFTAIFLVIVIETQRSYSRLSPKFRKSCVRIAVSLGSCGVAVLGIAMFAQIGLVSAGTVLSNEVLPSLNRSANPLTKIIMVSAFLVAAPIALIRTFRQLRFEELIYTLPRNGLIKLLVYKQPKATTFPEFAYMELSVLLACLVYASSVAEIAKVLMNIFKAV